MIMYVLTMMMTDMLIMTAWAGQPLGSEDSDGVMIISKNDDDGKLIMSAIIVIHKTQLIGIMIMMRCRISSDHHPFAASSE